NASMLGTLPVLTFHTVSLNPIQQYSKRLLDIIGSLIGIFITMLISIFVIPVIKLDSPGPIIFKQKRVGRYGRIFDIYKFRTMSVDAESRKCDLECLNEHKNGLMFKIKDDPRTTKAGVFLRKTSLDEFPQFFNVLKGDMSLVGTRPPTIDEYELYDYEHMRRLSIKPGITGLWQVNGRSSIKDFDMVVALDTQYIDNWSIWMDFNIMFLTIVKVVGMNSAY
ncbi:MAG: sugar transferase, partial [Fermentimonas sp.]|nr:sugar transferase [Fermentimonas sp.]